MEQAKKPRILSLVNQKGGVCKTTIAAQLTYGLARKGAKVLAIDMDPQGNLSTALAVGDMDGEPTTTEALLTQTLKPCYLGGSGNGAGYYAVPADISLAKTEMSLIGRADWQFLLTEGIKGLKHIPDLDFIIIDSPPNLGLLTINTLMAAEEVIIPMTCDNYSFNGLAALTDTISVIKRMNPSLTLAGVVAARVSPNRNIDKQSIKKMEETFPDILFASKIPECTALKVAGGLGKSIWDHDSGSLAATALASLCDEVMERGRRG